MVSDLFMLSDCGAGPVLFWAKAPLAAHQRDGGSDKNFPHRNSLMLMKEEPPAGVRVPAFLRCR
jgi:hypothetical protein